MGESGVNPGLCRNCKPCTERYREARAPIKIFRSRSEFFCNSSETKSFFMERYRHLQSVQETDLQKVQMLQNTWNRTLGLEPAASGALDNYNPVLARWNYERLQTDEQRDLFRENELRNITTALRERHQTQESRLELQIDADGKIRYEAFPDEPYEAMLERGQEYRAQHGSKDLERERAEIDGFKKIQSVLTSPDTPVGSTFIVISPPSEVEDSPYMHNFIDGYQSDIDPQTGERVIKYVRFSSPIDTEAYASIAQRFDPEFLTKKAEREESTGQSIPMDAWYLENPFFVPAQDGRTIDTVFTEHFAQDVEAMEEAEWQKIDAIYQPFKLYLLDQLTKENFDPIAIAKAYNILLLSQERENMHIKEDEHVIFDAKNHQLDDDVYKRIAHMAHTHGHESAKEVKAGCGNSGSIAIGSGRSGEADPLANSVGQFGLDKKDGDEQKCGTCGRSSKDNHYHCPGCTKQYSDETSKSADDRTKLCKCGFKFAC
jgi:hypothetical protein